MSKAIKMRVNKNPDSVCDICHKSRNQVLDMFDLSLNNHITTLCDVCNNELFNKALKANCYTNHRLKDKHDMKVIQKRNIDRRMYK